MDGLQTIKVALVSFLDDATLSLEKEINKAAKTYDFNLSLIRMQPSEKDRIGDDYHLILLVPKVRYEYLSFKKLAALLKIKVMVIDTIDFSALDGHAVFIKLLQTVRKSFKIKKTDN